MDKATDNAGELLKALLTRTTDVRRTSPTEISKSWAVPKAGGG
jgi:hypothetical protein